VPLPASTSMYSSPLAVFMVDSNLKFLVIVPVYCEPNKKVGT
jgi:hypothetical protein